MVCAPGDDAPLGTTRENAGTEWAAQLVTAHADFVRQTSEVFLGSLKSQLRS